MTDDVSWCAGVDWASEAHRACLLDREGRRVAEQNFTHGGAGLAELCDWLMAKAGAAAERPRSTSSRRLRLERQYRDRRRSRRPTSGR